MKQAMSLLSLNAMTGITFTPTVSMDGLKMVTMTAHSAENQSKMLKTSELQWKEERWNAYFREFREDNPMQTKREMTIAELSIVELL
jgi:hypothetical protein